MEKLILFVDDERHILSALKRALRKCDFSIRLANSPSEALQVIASEPIGVLVSDYTMPGMSGAELLAKAKDIRPDMTRIILSGNGDQQAVIEAINRGGAEKFLTKPWEEKELIHELEKAFQQRKEMLYTSQDSELLSRAGLCEAIAEALRNYPATNHWLACVNVSGLEKIRELARPLEYQNILETLILSRSEFPPAVDSAILEDGLFFLLLEATEESIHADLNRVLDQFTSVACFGEFETEVSYEAGYTAINSSDLSPTDYLSRAYSALHHAEGDDSRVSLFDDAMSARTVEYLHLQSRLRSALDNQEFLLHYQPKFLAGSRKLCGAEALIRWESPDHGMVSPAEFIPMAEQSDLINDIGSWVLGEAINQWMDWFGTTCLTTRVSVNVSARQLRNPKFVGNVQDLLWISGIPPQCVELELTESLLIDDVSECIRRLHQLKELGVVLSLDDFGTGFSSLHYLSKLPLDVIKIDRAFVSPISESDRARDTVRHMIDLGHDLGMEMVAEGVEEQAQLEFLETVGCDVIQGFYFSAPMAAIKFMQWLADYPSYMSNLSGDPPLNLNAA